MTIFATKMESVVKVASYICERYQREFGERIDEMKLHKLLYLTQRESIAQTGKPIFRSTFHAWKYGPVLPQIRNLYKQNALNVPLPEDSIRKYEPVFDYIFTEYAGKRSFVLSNITHGEYAWLHAREGYAKFEDSDVRMTLEDIAKDAQALKERRLLLKYLNAMEIHK